MIPPIVQESMADVARAEAMAANLQKLATALAAMVKTAKSRHYDLLTAAAGSDPEALEKAAALARNQLVLIHGAVPKLEDALSEVSAALPAYKQLVEDLMEALEPPSPPEE